jgi:hypothetical protein
MVSRRTGQWQEDRIGHPAPEEANPEAEPDIPGPTPRFEPVAIVLNVIG